MVHQSANDPFQLYCIICLKRAKFYWPFQMSSSSASLVQFALSERAKQTAVQGLAPNSGQCVLTPNSGHE